jgi:hypothetical protein
MAAHEALSFAPGRHYGIVTQRTARWFGDCTCWKAYGSFKPFTL